MKKGKKCFLLFWAHWLLLFEEVERRKGKGVCVCVCVTCWLCENCVCVCDLLTENCVCVLPVDCVKTAYLEGGGCWLHRLILLQVWRFAPSSEPAVQSGHPFCAWPTHTWKVDWKWEGLFSDGSLSNVLPAVLRILFKMCAFMKQLFVCISLFVVWARKSYPSAHWRQKVVKSKWFGQWNEGHGVQWFKIYQGFAWPGWGTSKMCFLNGGFRKGSYFSVLFLVIWVLCNPPVCF